jgi:hypothetical protein
MRRIACLLLATLGWMAGLALRSIEPPLAPAAVAGILGAAAGGEERWRCAACWGWRGTWLDSAPADRQREPDGCGAASLAVLLRHQRRGITQELLWSVCRLPHGGTSLGRLAWAARCFGVGCRVCWSPDPATLPVPALVHLRRGHFVVLLQSDSHNAWILDPACGRVRVPRRELAARSSGAALVLEPASASRAAPLLPSLEEDS